MFSKVDLKEVIYVIGVILTIGITYGKIQSDLTLIRDNQERAITRYENMTREVMDLKIQLARMTASQEVRNEIEKSAKRR